MITKTELRLSKWVTANGYYYRKDQAGWIKKDKTGEIILNDQQLIAQYEDYNKIRRTAARNRRTAKTSGLNHVRIKTTKAERILFVRQFIDEFDVLMNIDFKLRIQSSLGKRIVALARSKFKYSALNPDSTVLSPFLKAYKQLKKQE